MVERRGRRDRARDHGEEGGDRHGPVSSSLALQALEFWPHFWITDVEALAAPQPYNVATPQRGHVSHVLSFVPPRAIRARCLALVEKAWLEAHGVSALWNPLLVALDDRALTHDSVHAHFNQLARATAGRTSLGRVLH